MPIRNTHRYNETLVEHTSLLEFTRTNVKKGLNSIQYENHVMDILIDPHESAQTIIFSFNPAVTNDAVTRPYFVGAGLFKSLYAHKVYLSDPSLELHEDLRLAWFAGNREQRNLRWDTANALRHIAADLGAKNIILVGTSGGGFASLLYSSMIPGSLAFVVNPQTDLMRYHPQHVAKYAKLAWGMTFEKSKEILPKRTTTSVIERYALGPDHSVIYLQSATDLHHIENHMIPLLQCIHERTNTRIMLETGWGPGHNPAPKELQMQLLSSLVESNGDWNAKLTDYPQFLEPAEAMERAVRIIRDQSH